ncbi:hypothetical protein BT63DRAFT_441002 [Microthyrium microscopicum]|uniref:Cora-domain-containing protein n=1 Tax=Microthyrium microscopicum TaxID=703497 RepID=A0A6A6U6P0_9PEZI|nr:hypothetical protein BT63DRAFT_441002 [Microthyrium microscopicum]
MEQSLLDQLFEHASPLETTSTKQALQIRDESGQGKGDIFGEFTKAYTFEWAATQRHTGLHVQDGTATKHCMQSEEQVAAWLMKDTLKPSPQGETHQWNLRIIAFEALKPVGAMDRHLFVPLPLSRKLFLQISVHFELSAAYLGALTSRNVEFSRAFDYRNTTTENSGKLKYVFKQDWSSSPKVSVALTYDPKTRQSVAVVFGLYEYYIDRLFSTVEESRSLLLAPMIVPIVALEHQTQRYEKTSAHIRRTLNEAERATGMRFFANPSWLENGVTDNILYEPEEIADWRDADLIKMSQTVNTIASYVAFDENQLKRTASILDFIEQETAELRDKCFENQEDDLVFMHNAMLSKLRQLRAYRSGILGQYPYLAKRIGAHTQTLLNLFTLKDNEAMKTMAELSRQDNIAILKLSETSTQIAEDSRAIASATARDSSSMRVIANVTILFLPATFIATFFSMSFFNFQHPNGPKTVATEIWIYVVCAVALTLLIQALWVYMSRKLELRISKMQNQEEVAEQMLLSAKVNSRLTQYTSRVKSLTRVRSERAQPTDRASHDLAKTTFRPNSLNE